MGIDITRLQQKKADGSYDIVHPETQAKAVWMADGRSVEEAVGAGGSGGGGDVFNVTANIAFGSGYDVTLSNVSHTYDEIYGAFEAGKVVVLTMMTPVGGTGAAAYVAYLSMDSEYAQQYEVLNFTCNDYAMVIQIAMASTGEISGRWCYYVPAGAPASDYLYAGDNYQSANTSLLRNTKLVPTDTTPTVEGEIFLTYG